jgi:hypothetical protein
MAYNKVLLKLAAWRLKEQEKVAFVPAGDPSMASAAPGAGGAPPGADPAGAGGMPPMDPSAAMTGGAPAPPAPAPDPSMAGGSGAAPMPSGGGGLDADRIRQIIRQEMMQHHAQGGGGGAGGAGGPAKPKQDINTVSMDMYQVKKMLTYFFNQQGIPLPPDILDGPNRDPSTGMPMPAGMPGSTSDPAKSQAAPPQSAIQPIQPMQPAMPEKQGRFDERLFDIGADGPSAFTGIKHKTAAVAELIKALNNRGNK